MTDTPEHHPEPHSQNRYIVVGLMVLHSLLLGWNGFRHSPTEDEIAHLPAGIAIWRMGATDLYRVNPPLVRTVAALPVLFTNHKEDWSRYANYRGLRSEWHVGRDFLLANQDRTTWLFALARWMCIPFSLLGLWTCWQWGRELTSDQGGLIAATLWTFSPNILGHGALITPDIAAVSIGLFAAYRFEKWSEHPQLPNAFFAGIALGAAMLTKSYWIFLPGIWTAMFLFRNARALITLATLTRNQLAQFVFLLFVSLNILCLGYGNRGLFIPLKDYEFYSETLTGKTLTPGYDLPGNRFADSPLGKFPVPVPKDFITGIDLQKLDFERGHWAYLLGVTKTPGGWWYYYVVGLFVKVPLGTWLLASGGLYVIIRYKRVQHALLKTAAYWLPVVILFVIASLNTGMNRHVRYVFPLLPCLYLLGAVCFFQFEKTQRRRRMAIIAVGLTIISSLSVYPHSLSFFNAAVGGPLYGDRYLADSNLDWGQDNLYLQEWLTDHPDARPVRGSGIGYCSLKDYGINIESASGERTPGWYVISRSAMHNPNGLFDQFKMLTPVDRIGFTYNVYEVSSKDLRKD